MDLLLREVMEINTCFYKQKQKILKNIQKFGMRLRVLKNRKRLHKNQIQLR